MPENFFYIDLESVKDDRIVNYNFIQRNNAPSRAQRLLIKNDILFSGVRPYQHNNAVFLFENGKYVASTGFIQIRYKFPFFLLGYFSNDRFSRAVNIRSTGSSYPAINSYDLSRIKIFVPSEEEQSDISKLIIVINKKINNLESKISTLKKYKKGLIQKLIGKIVFTDYYRLSDVCKIDTGKLDANQMVVDGKYKFFTCSRDDFYINSYAFNCEAILVSGNGDVGFSKYYKGKFNAYQRTYVLHDFLVNAKYVKIIFDNNVNKIVRKETNIGAMPYIRKSTFDKVLIPKLKKESIEYIVNIYDSLSYKIDTLEAKLSLLKSFWHQLLKDMFI